MTSASRPEKILNEHRIASLEAAFMELLGRVEVLEQALRFEIDQRVELEKVILKTAGLGKRIDRLELEARAARRGGVPPHPVAEVGE